MNRAVMPSEELTGKIIEAGIQVHRILGPGLSRETYLRALEVELARVGLIFEARILVPVQYEGQQVGEHPLDLIVQGEVLAEVRLLDEILPKHYAEVRTLLRLANLDVALLMNFLPEKLEVRRVTRKKNTA